jgi:2-keto-4-pentenoate hydratase/2-oxohepta-3-ene-1,7-dioic acid hydratase in catechol pathway
MPDIVHANATNGSNEHAAVYRLRMRFATYERAGDAAQRCGVITGDTIRPLPEGTTLLALIDAGPGALLAAGQAAIDGPAAGAVPVSEARLLPPLRPRSIRDYVAFEAHIEGVIRAQEGRSEIPPAWYEAPAFYFTNPHACVGARDDVEIFPGSERFDFECEVAAVTGAGGRDLTPAQAEAAIIGYTIFNDWSARDIQQREGRLPFGFAKGKDGAHTLGPWLVTADELGEHRTGDGYLDLTMTVELNGQVLSRDSSASASWTFGELIAYASAGAPVAAGDAFGSGTCGGGCLAEIWGRAGRREPPPLSPGDVVTLTVEGIGTVSNRVVAGRPAAYLPPARPRSRGPRH